MELLETLSEALADQLHVLYQNEWWSAGRTREETARVLEGSDLTLGLVQEGTLVGFARVLTDGVFKALIFDVMVAPEQRGSDLGRRLIDEIISHPKLSGVKHFELYCRPRMVPFYEKWGFTSNLGEIRLMRREA
ncbi:MAG: GNAT family N-acetyltransferase [Chrysiogenetes bacterium]|nr:GNAT family N-acetyltransferase [Chrysiogenetes bacterium]